MVTSTGDLNSENNPLLMALPPCTSNFTFFVIAPISRKDMVVEQTNKQRFGTERRSNIEENINEMSSYDGSLIQDMMKQQTQQVRNINPLKNSDLSGDNNSGRTETKQSETKTINSPNEKK
jgi:hypothetical protein